MNRRYFLSSLLGVAAFSGAVVAEAEHNYATITRRDEAAARVDDVSPADGALRVTLAVENPMNEGLRVQYVHIEVSRRESVDAASFPYNGSRTLAPGRSTLTPTVPERQLTGELTDGEPMTVTGYLAVEVYNEYRFEIPIEPAEVTL
ncbi:MAG: hypothetical protein ABEH90_06575 [Halolamina sp.]